LSLGLVFFYIFKNFLILFQGKLQIAFTLNNQADYTKRLYKYYINKPYLFHVDTNFSVILRNINLGCIIVFSQILTNTLIIITNIITMIVIWILLLIMDWVMAIVIAFILAPLMLGILNYFRKKINKYGTRQNECNVEYIKWLNQGFWSVKETKVMQKEAFFTEEFSKAFNEFTVTQKQFLFINRFPKCIIEMVCVGGILLLITFKMIFNTDPSSIIPALGVLALAAMRLMPCMNQITGLFNEIKFKMPFFNEVYDDFIAIKNEKKEDEINSQTGQKERIPFNKEISVTNLTFGYPDTNKNVFENVSFTIPKGKFVGVVGPSGAGKTTFVDILLGLLQPSGGSINVDGKNIFENIQGWLDNVSYVPQSIYLIDGTIRENIAFGILPEDIDDKRIEKVLKMAELYDFVQSLELKENTPCGDKGAKLSGGQKQRIGIARALYQNPSVLILDEATSALDTETEKQITETINKLKGEITIIAIAHRLSTLENCDFKIKFENNSATIIEEKI
ncbi:MAG: ABC transporter ATP-binding protein, partial [Treponema sp.]|nr:ABC transporter ATP-binding protein [Treponema sp.]